MEKQKNVFIKSAELGVPFGVLLIVASVSMLFGDRVPLLSTLTLAVAIAAPFIIYRWQRKRFIESNGFATFSELWTLGIFTAIGGALICALVTYFLITFFRPDFLYDQAQLIVDTYKQMPNQQAHEISSMVEKIIKNDLIPTPIDYCMQMFWLTASLGCVGGALTALIAGRRLPKDNTTPPPFNNNNTQ